MEGNVVMRHDREKEQEEIERIQQQYLFTYPKSFSKSDPKLIKTFADRLKAVRIKRDEQSKTDNGIARKDWSQKAIGQELGITAAGYGRYEKANLKSIPMKNIAVLCDIFNVTPHYLFGYAQDESAVVELDENGNIAFDESGKPKELKTAFVFYRKSQRETISHYAKLTDENPFLFELIRKLMAAPESKKSVCINVLSALLENL